MQVWFATESTALQFQVNFVCSMPKACFGYFVCPELSSFGTVELEFEGSKSALLPDAVAQVDTGQIHSICARNLWGPSRKMS